MPMCPGRSSLKISLPKSTVEPVLSKMPS